MTSLILKDWEAKGLNEGRITQIRRPLKVQPPPETSRLIGPKWYTPIVIDRHGEEQPGDDIFGVYDEWGEYGCKSPYAPEDILVCKETWGGPYTPEVLYKADPAAAQLVAEWRKDPFYPQIKWLSPVTMAKEYSRLSIQVTEVRGEKLQSITDADAAVSGVEAFNDDGVTYYGPFDKGHASARYAFIKLWDAHAKPGEKWADNPWVFCFGVRRVEA